MEARLRLVPYREWDAWHEYCHCRLSETLIWKAFLYARKQEAAARMNTVRGCSGALP